MSKHIFECIDAHTCGNPIRLIKSGGPKLEGKTMLDKREHFMAEYNCCLLYTSPSPRDATLSRMPSSA